MEKIKVLFLNMMLLVFLSACGGASEEGGESVNLSNINDSLTQNGEDNAAPVVSGNPDTTVDQGSSYSFTPNAADADNDQLVFSIFNKPDWATFDTQTGALTGTPSTVGVTENVQIIVTDGHFIVSLDPFTITVQNNSNNNNQTINQAPTISGLPASNAPVGGVYQFSPTANDANGDSLTFNIVNKPGWLSFNMSTGVITGTPDASDIGVYNNIYITVSDGATSVALTPFSVTVSLTNLPPEVSGTPSGTAREDAQYSYLPVANDPENDVLTFTVVNKPAWLTFDASTGRLTGVPGSEDVATYSNIQISASDGDNSVLFANFDLTVESTSALLSWTAPSTNSDSSPLELSDLGGYKIYSGTSPSNLTLLANVDDSSVTEYKDSGLTPATYYYAVTAYNQSGDESEQSVVVSKTIN